MTPIFRLSKEDFLKGLVTAIIGSVIITLYSVVTAPGFNLFTINWNIVLQSTITAAVAAFLGYVGKNFLSDENGKFLGKIG